MAVRLPLPVTRGALVAARPAAALDFFGPFPTLGALLAATPGVLRADELQRRAVVPVCYGGTFAAVWISLSA